MSSDTYTTKSGDVWDRIAYDVYGDELKMDWLLENNIKLVHIVVFDAGTVINTPELPETETTQTAMPAWREATT